MTGACNNSEGTDKLKLRLINMCRSLTDLMVRDCTETIYQRLTKPMPAHADTISRGPIPHSYTLLRHQAQDLYDYIRFAALKNVRSKVG